MRKIIYIIIILISGSVQLKAQLNPLGSQYYINQYLINPAFAGTDQGLKVNGAFRKLWSNINGSPISQSLTADYGFSKVGIGLNVTSESAGLQREIRAVATYAYHLKLNNDANQLHFGISGGFTNQRLENSSVNGDPNDPLINQYNDRDTYIDGDFGVAFTTNKLTVQGSIPNMKSFLKKETIKQANVNVFYSAISYKFNFNEGMNLVQVEPKVALRGVRGFDSIWDAGTLVSIANKKILFTGIYHSTESGTFGLGMDFQNKYLINAMYTTETSALSGYTNGSFEVNLRLNLSK
jgi:type IX secretion system PorP/SprF family membrane protein